MIYNKLYNLSNQTAQPGTLQNIKARFHHHKVHILYHRIFYSTAIQASKNISNFYACYDLMEITTLSNLVALAIEVSQLSYEATDAHLTKDAFENIVDAIFDKIDLLKKWESRPSGEGDTESDDETDMEGYESQDEGGNEDRVDNFEAAAENEEDDELLGFYLG